MKKAVLLLLLCAALAGLIFLRGEAAREKGALADPPPTTAVPTATSAQTPAPTPAPEPSASVKAPAAPTPTPFAEPTGYTKETYELVSDMVYAYANGQEAAEGTIRADLERLNTLDPALGSLWGKLMRLWSRVNTELVVNEALLPDGLPGDDSLCIVVLGFQLEPGGSMSPELEGRCGVALACAEKYPQALVAVTGGGTAWQNPSATEAGVMAAWLTEHGIEKERIIIEDASLTTADNAAFTCAILRERYPQVSTLTVVSSDYHLPLGVLLFQEQAYLYEYETGTLPFTVVSNAALKTDGRVRPDSPISQKPYLWSLADPRY